MSEHFIRYIDIESYKCFQSFSAKGFKRVNLVSGKNNIGKTALLESFLLNTIGIKGLYALLSLFGFYIRRIRNDYIGKSYDGKVIFSELRKQVGFIGQKTNINEILIKREGDEFLGKYKVTTSKMGEEYCLLNDLIQGGFSSSDFENKTGHISTSGETTQGLIRSFSSIQKSDREDEFYSFINEFDDSIESVKVIDGNKIQCKVSLADGGFAYRDLHEFGDGLKQYIAVIVDLYAHKNGYFFIDEIDAGIHYSSLDKLWKIILTLSKEMNVQVFATTHSRECIESYCRVAKSLNEQDISFTTLVKNKESQIKAIVRDYEVFTNSIDQGHEVRGW